MEPWLVFGGYVFVVVWNLASAFAVLWLFLRDSTAITGAHMSEWLTEGVCTYRVRACVDQEGMRIMCEVAAHD